MIWSNFSKNGYVVGLAKSDSGEIDSKWEQLQPLYEKGARADFTTDGGHAMMFEDFSGKLRLALHGPNSKSDDDFEHLLLFHICEQGGVPAIE